MAKFGGNEFVGFSIPLIFEGRYFLMEQGESPLMTVVLEEDGEPVFEILKNQPVDNPFSETTVNPTGIVTVSDKDSGKFLYKIRPGSETSVVFGKLDGGEISAKITDRSIQVGGIKLENNMFIGNMAGVVVDATGSIGVGAAIPSKVLDWLK